MVLLNPLSLCASTYKDCSRASHSCTSDSGRSSRRHRPSLSPLWGDRWPLLAISNLSVLCHQAWSGRNNMFGFSALTVHTSHITAQRDVFEVVPVCVQLQGQCQAQQQLSAKIRVYRRSGRCAAAAAGDPWTTKMLSRLLKYSQTVTRDFKNSWARSCLFCVGSNWTQRGRFWD